MPQRTTTSDYNIGIGTELYGSTSLIEILRWVIVFDDWTCNSLQYSSDIPIYYPGAGGDGYNIAIGDMSMYGGTGGLFFQYAMGQRTLYSITTGLYNTVIGHQPLYKMKTPTRKILHCVLLDITK